jgi:hypothetical protein
MSRFGDAALLAVKFCTNYNGVPRDAWKRAVAELNFTKSMQDKGCPRSTFLAMCEAKAIVGIPAGDYGCRARENRVNALNALRHLRNNPSLALNPAELWRITVDGKKTKHNEEMGVLIALWNDGLITSQG